MHRKNQRRVSFGFRRAKLERGACGPSAASQQEHPRHHYSVTIISLWSEEPPPPHTFITHKVEPILDDWIDEIDVKPVR